jgi:hypothetical protein
MVFNATFNNISGSSWPWSYGSWIYNYQFNQCLSPMMLWVRISIRARCTTLCDKVCQWLTTGRWFSTGTPVSSTNQTDRHDITEILLKVALNTINQPNINLKKNHRQLHNDRYISNTYIRLWTTLCFDNDTFCLSKFVFSNKSFFC